MYSVHTIQSGETLAGANRFAKGAGRHGSMETVTERKDLKEEK